MSKKANPTLIGLFFVIGTALGVGAMLVFSTRNAFHPKKDYILYFDGSLKGLNLGAPVKIRGVHIGMVREILIRHNQASNDFSMPVIISVDKKLAQTKSDQVLRFTEERMKELVAAGYRARLEAESLVTGVLYVEFEIIQNAPPPVYHQLDPEFDEIPTAPSTVQQFLANLSQLDLARVSEKVNTLLARVDQSLSQLNLVAINSGITNLLVSANRVMGSSDLTNALASLRRSLDDAGRLVNRIDGRVDGLADGATNTLHDAQKTLADLRVAVQTISDLLGPDSAIPSDLRQALQELSTASQAITDLAAFLERNPNALLTGKKRPKEIK